MRSRMMVAAAIAGLLPSPRVVHAQSPPGVNQYTVTFDTSGLRPRIVAEVTATGGRLLMAGWGADMHARGWAEFIRDLVVEDVDGRRAEARPDSGASWTLADTTTRPVRLRYAVDLSFITAAWPYGNEQAGTRQGRDVFIVSKALFITTPARGPRHVRFTVPAGWHVAAPWPVRGSRGTDYVAESDDALLNNSIVVGPSAPVEIRAGAFTFVLAALGETAGEQPQLASALRQIVPEYVRIFPGTPETRYVLTVFRARERDAEAFQSSAAFSEVEPMTEGNRLEWAGTIAHELLHSWNGARIRPEPYAELQWVSEGFTDYLSTRTLARTGVIDERLFMRRMEQTIAGYLYFKAAPAFEGVTLKAAGARKGTHRLGVYNGGWVAAFCLDTDLRSRTAGARSIDDVLRALFERHALQDRPYTESDLRSILTEIGGAPAARFMDEHAVGDAVIPVGDCLERAGYRGFGVGYKAEFYVEPAHATPFRRWLTGSAADASERGQPRR